MKKFSTFLNEGKEHLTWVVCDTDFNIIDEFNTEPWDWQVTKALERKLNKNVKDIKGIDKYSHMFIFEDNTEQKMMVLPKKYVEQGYYDMNS